MNIQDSNAKEIGLTTKRIEGLTDGVFAIAMTLLVLTLEIPEPLAENTTGTLAKLLISQHHKLFNYVLSFILLSLFWIIHHRQFHFVKRTDHQHLWLNVFILMFVALIPFSTSLLGDYPRLQLANVAFELNVLIIGLLFFSSWSYATHNHRLVNSDLTPERIQLGKRRGLVIPVVSVIAIALSFLSPRWSTLPYLSIPFILSKKQFR